MKNFSAIFLVLLTHHCFSQIQRNTGQITGGTYSGSTIETFSSVLETFPDDNYLYPEWYYGDINIKGSDGVDVKKIPIKYNVVRNTLEFKQEKVLKEIDLSVINSFELLIPSELNPLIFVSLPLDEKPTMFKTIYLGSKYSLFVKYDSEIIPADYNPQWDTGSKVDRVRISDSYYLRDESNNTLSEIKLNRNRFLDYFKTRNTEIYKYLKKNKPGLGTDSEARDVLDQINKI